MSSVSVPRHASLLRLALTNSSCAFCTNNFCTAPKSIIGGRTGETEALNACLEMLTLLFAIRIDACLSREQKKLMYIIVAVVFGLIIQDYLDYRMSLYEKLPKLRTFNGITDYVLWQLIYLQVSLSIAE